MKTEERRKYVRLNKIYPIELKVIDLKNNPQSSLLQGFTRDISYNGVCVEVNDFQPEYLKSLENNLSRIILYINIPFKRQPVKAVGRVAWAKNNAAEANA
ncbi:MAG: PilZ domain-containing protein [Candidatus Omnitrophica bacterium]|nr:PilZ domain-containing protein [Candidatus Omnitrophota bacterium]